MLWYTLGLVPVTLAPVALGRLGPIYLAVAIGMNVWFVAATLRLLREQTPEAARHVFRVSLAYLFSLFVASQGKAEPGSVRNALAQKIRTTAGAAAAWLRRHCGRSMASPLLLIVLVAEAVRGRRSVGDEVARLRGRFLELGYCFPEGELEGRLAELRTLA
jgi:hypothetical protein